MGDVDQNLLNDQKTPVSYGGFATQTRKTIALSINSTEYFLLIKKPVVAVYCRKRDVPACLTHEIILNND